MSQALHFHIEEEENCWTEARPYYISIAINAGNEIRDSTNATGAVYLKFLKALFENVKKNVERKKHSMQFNLYAVVLASQARPNIPTQIIFDQLFFIKSY